MTTSYYDLYHRALKALRGGELEKIQDDSGVYRIQEDSRQTIVGHRVTYGPTSHEACALRLLSPSGEVLHYYANRQYTRLASESDFRPSAGTWLVPAEWVKS